MIKGALKIPLLLVALVVVLLTLAWLPGQQTPVQQRPYVDLVIHYPLHQPRLQTLAEDIRYRMNTHHEYRLLSEQAPVNAGLRVHRVKVELAQEDSHVWITAQVDQAQFRVDGPVNAASSLSAKVFSLINDALNQG